MLPREIFFGSELVMRALVWNMVSDPKGYMINSANITPIVLIHGIGDSADIWKPVIHSQPDLFIRPCIAIDLPGHGLSQQLNSGSYQLEIISRLIGEALKSIGVHRAILIGHSLGGRVIINLASAYIDPESLILIDMGLNESQATQKIIINHIKDMIRGSTSKQGLVDKLESKMPLVNVSSVRQFIDGLVIRDGILWRFPTDINSVELLHEENSKKTIANLKKITAPVTFIRGAYSSIARRDDVINLFSVFEFPFILHEVSKAGHAIMIEQPDSLANIIHKVLL
jgi:pimeloyl-ACP methyl ester carboxylesterase